MRPCLHALASASALLPVQIACRHASASLCLAVARAPLLMHLVIHLVRQIESPPLPPEAADARPLYEILLLLLCCGSCALTCASWPLHSRLLRPYPGVLAPVIVLLHRCCRPGVARRPGTNDGSIRAARLENEVVRCTAGALVAAATRCAPAAPPCEPV